MTTSVSLSTFTRTPRRVLPLLTSGDVLLTRRNGPDLRLSMVSDETTDPVRSTDAEHTLNPDAPAPETDVPEVTDAIDADVEAGNARRDLSDPVAIELGAILAGLVGVADRRRLARVLTAACPWMSDLPPAARRRFVAELADSAAPNEDLRGPGDVLDQWRRTSQVFARA